MTWSSDRIEKELLSGPASTVALPSETLVTAVNRVEQTLGEGWIESEISQVKGLSVAVRVIGMGLRLLVACNQFYVTLKKVDHEPPHSFPLSRVEINFDNLRNTLQLEISDPNRNAWSVQQEQKVHQVVGFEMTHEGQLLLNHLVALGKAEFGRQLLPEVSTNIQNEQMQIAVKRGLIRCEPDSKRIHNFYIVNPEYVDALKKVLPEILN